MNLLAGRAAKDHQQQKAMVLLRYLRSTVYSTQDLLALLLRVSNPQHVSKFLKQMEEARLLVHREFSELGGKITLWGITHSGQSRALHHGEELNQSVFNPSKVSPSLLLHYLDIQKIRILAEQAGWQFIYYPDRHRRKNLASNKNRPSPIWPDLVLIDPHGHKAALEYERTRKSFDRYKTEILPGHVRNMNAGEYEFVLWIAPTEDDQKALHRIISRTVDELIAEQKWHFTLAPAAFKRFQFANLATWPNY
jgi:hypothetical protein